MSTEEKQFTIERRGAPTPPATTFGSAPVAQKADDPPPAPAALQQDETSEARSEATATNSVKRDTQHAEAASVPTQAAEQPRAKLTLQERLDRKKCEVEQVMAQYEKLQSRYKAEARKRDDRRKIVTGAHVWAMAKAGDPAARAVLERIRQNVPERDRHLFEEDDGSTKAA